MKRKILAAILAALCLMTASCGAQNDGGAAADSPKTADIQQTYDVAPSEVTAAILLEIPINSAIEKGIADLGAYFSDLDTSGITEASYYMCASGAYPDEIAVFRFSSAELAESGKAAVQTRLDKQISVYESYTPDEMYKLENAVIEVKGNYIYYLVTSDNVKAKEIAEGLIS